MKLSIQKLQCFHPKLGGECSVVMSALYSGLRSCSPSCFASNEKTWTINKYKLNAYKSTSVIRFIRSHRTTSVDILIWIFFQLVQRVMFTGLYRFFINRI